MEELSFEGDYGLSDSFRSDSDPHYPQPSALTQSFVSNSPTLRPASYPVSTSLRLSHLPAIHIPSQAHGLLGKLERLTARLQVYEEEIERLRQLQPSEGEIETELKAAKSRVEQDEVQMKGMRGEIEALQRTVEGLRASTVLSTEVRELKAEKLKAEILRRDKEQASYQGTETRLKSIDELKRLRQSLDE